MNVQAQKAVIIEQFKQVNDVNLINAIKNMLDYALKKEQESFEVPEAHQKLVMERFDKVRKNPERLLDWDEAKKTLKA
jgi:aspartate/methionine/tyrosine aminotransferase